MSYTRKTKRRLPLLLALLFASLLTLTLMHACTVDFSIGAGGNSNDAGTTSDAAVTDDALVDPDALVNPDAAPDATTCIPTEAVEGTCTDGLDNDCDGATDCDDPHCGAQPCDDGNPDTFNDTCEAGVCVGISCIPTETQETTCDDGLDNDCNGYADCADVTACEGTPCDDGDPDTKNDQCSTNGICEGTPCTWETVCQQCGTGVCNDVLVHEDPGCGCQQSVPSPGCWAPWSYSVPCGGGYECDYERREETEPCNCHQECN